jgi:metallo-beta-lactamase family protein
MIFIEMEVRILGAAKEVTGSCFSISTKEEKILIDCGMFQGSKEIEKLNYDNFDFEPKEYDALLLTHAHLDHCGRIPKLSRYGFKGKIYATNATKELAFLIMMDAAKIAEEDTAHENKRRTEQGLSKRKPIYNEFDVENVMKRFIVVDYDQDIKITKNIIAKFYDAGHILGSASIQLKVTEGKKANILAFSGDMGQERAVLVKNTEPIAKADYVFIESTYGDRLHPPIEERKRDLIRIINETYKKRGKLMIASFAVERAQEIIYLLGEFMQDGTIPNMKVFLDSPMAARATEVLTRYTRDYNDSIQESMKKRKDPFNFPGLIFTKSVGESKKINSINEPCIVIAGNGMCTGGRIKHHIINNISNPKNTLLLVGYQVEGTLGYWLKNGEKKIDLLGESVDVKAKVESIEGFSAHADYNGLIKWLNDFSPKPKKVFIIHGDEDQTDGFSKRISKLGFECYVPSLGESLVI